MIAIPRFALPLALLFSSNAAVEATACSDVPTRLVEVSQRILQLLPPGAEMTRFVPDESKARGDGEDCPELLIRVAITTRRIAQAHALAYLLRKEPGIVAVEITQTRMAPPNAVHTDLQLKVR